MSVRDAQVMGRLTVEWLTATVEGTLRLLAARGDAAAIDLGLRRANATLEAFERLLGVAPGSLRRVDRQVVARLAPDIPRIEAAKPGVRAPAAAGRSRSSPSGGRPGRPPRQKGAPHRGRGTSKG